MLKRIEKISQLVAAGVIATPALGSLTVMAAEQAHGDAHGGGQHGGGEASAGLPQFDPSTYSSQIFWLTATFLLLYVIFSIKTLPEISSVLENRKERIQGDLTSAENLRENAEKTQKQYESLLEESRMESTRLLNEVTAEMQEKSAAKMADFQTKAQKEIKSLEENVAKAKQDAMKDMNKVAAEVARNAAEKIVGIKADMKQAETVVQSLSKQEAA